MNRHAASLEGFNRSDLMTKTHFHHASSSGESRPPGIPEFPPRKRETCSMEELQSLEEASILRQLACNLPFRSPAGSSELFFSQFKPPSNQQLNAPVQSINKNRVIGPNVQQQIARKMEAAVLPAMDTASKERLTEANCNCEESQRLRQQNEQLKQALSRLQKFEHLESELEKLSQSYSALLASTAKREMLEKAMFRQLEVEKEKQVEENNRLQAKIEDLTNQLRQANSSEYSAEHYRQLNFRLLELEECREQQEIELVAQRATLDEQRNHINILESALASAQSEVKKRQQIIERFQQQTRAVRNAASKSSGAARLVRQRLSNEGLPKVPEASSNESIDQQPANPGPVDSNDKESAPLTPKQHTDLEARVRNLESQLEKTSVTAPEAPPKDSNSNGARARTRSFGSVSDMLQAKHSVSGSDPSVASDDVPDRRPKSRAEGQIIKPIKGQLWHI